MLEKDVKKKVKDYFNKLPFCYLYSYSAYLGETGLPDIMGTISGDAVGFEAKQVNNPGTSKYKTTPNQKKKLRLLADRGMIVGVVTSVDHAIAIAIRNPGMIVKAVEGLAPEDVELNMELYDRTFKARKGIKELEEKNYE